VPAEQIDVLVGVVAQLYQGDLDLGRVAAERLVHHDLGAGVVVEDLSYGAVAVAQRLEDVRPGTLILVGATQRGRMPGTVERREIVGLPRDPAEIQRAIADAVTGYVHIDLVLEVAYGLGALPPRTVTIEVEPASVEPSETLSPAAEAALLEVVALVRDEVGRVRA
jgi:hydrogenase maturation protease